MSRYVVKFSKEGNIRYISHLDLLRLFKRSFKRVGIKLQHSQGFNPHPKMSFAQPLSLGYLSTGEYLEFETIEPYDTESMTEKLNTVLPEGIGILSCSELPQEGRTMAALTFAADYEITFPSESSIPSNLNELTEKYLTQEQVIVLKHQKKTRKDIEVDIKPMIFSMSSEVNDNDIMITCRIAAGSTQNLNPEMVLNTFCEFAGIRFDRAEAVIRRTEIYFGN